MVFQQVRQQMFPTSALSNGQPRAIQRAPAVLALVLVAGCGGRTTPADALAEYLDGLAAHHTLTGAVLVARAGKILVSRGYGLADEPTHLPNGAETRFRIGSITKQFTAAAILVLQERGKLTVQDPICHYVPDCPPQWQPITLEHLLTHSSGIPNYTEFEDFDQLLGTPVTVVDLIGRFKPRPLDFAAGERWSYSNSGYILLGAVVEKISGESYADFLGENVFAPLVLTGTGYDTNDPPLPTHASGYLNPGEPPVRFDMSEVYAAGALYSTVGNLYVWDQALLADRLLSAASLAAMTTVHVPCPAGGCALSTDLGYGYGWFIANPSGRPYIYHWGHIDGFKSSNGFYPEDQLIVVVLSNLETTDVWSISSRLGELALTR